MGVAQVAQVEEPDAIHNGVMISTVREGFIVCVCVCVCVCVWRYFIACTAMFFARYRHDSPAQYILHLARICDDTTVSCHSRKSIVAQKRRPHAPCCGHCVVDQTYKFHTIKTKEQKYHYWEYVCSTLATIKLMKDTDKTKCKSITITYWPLS